MTRLADAAVGMSLREFIFPALSRLEAFRDNEVFQYDTRKKAVRTAVLAEEILNDGYPKDAKSTAIELWELAKQDQSLRPLANYVGGYHSEPWNNHEWSLPPVAPVK